MILLLYPDTVDAIIETECDILEPCSLLIRTARRKLAEQLCRAWGLRFTVDLDFVKLDLSPGSLVV
jgi:hypothetical protein